MTDTARSVNDTRNAVDDAKHSVFRTGGNATPATDACLYVDLRMLRDRSIGAAFLRFADVRYDLLFLQILDLLLPNTENHKKRSEQNKDP